MKKRNRSATKRLVIQRKIISKLTNFSLRTKIMSVVMISLIFMGITISLIGRIDHYSITIIGESYKSNEQISILSEMLNKTEEAMESYVVYSSFETIESFYNYKTKVENYIMDLNPTPSINETVNKEYIIRQLIESFLNYSDMVVSARRANIPEQQNLYFEKAVSCYSMLMNEIRDFESYIHQVNSHIYRDNRNHLFVLSNIICIFFVGYFIMVTIYIYVLISRIIKPLQDISDVALQVSMQNFDVPLFNNDSKNEIGNICRAFDKMLISINEYVNTIMEKARTESELREQQIETQALYTAAKLRVLQAQINPHFLFNTLNTGSQLAMMEGADKTCDFIEQLAAFFRYNIQDKQDSSIDEELLLIDHFVYIMKVRFGARLIFEKDVPNLDLPQKMPVMILQPLVENCIKHGLENATGIVKLKVRVTDEFVEISVSDNGKGFDSEIRKKILNEVRLGKTNPDSYSVGKTRDSNGIGITNVFTRMKLYFHRDDIFDIQNNDIEKGTKFIVRIPADV